MAKLYFRYGAMGSSKTANALMVRYNYQEKGQNALMLKPKSENRDGEKKIKSRIGLEYDCMFVEDVLEKGQDFICGYDVLIVDEAQFLTAEQVDSLSDIVDFYNIPVICYGLKTDFQTKLFEGSKRLMELADVIEEVPTVCWCGKRAQVNTRITDDAIITHGDQIMLGGNDAYISLCRKHYKTGEVKKGIILPKR